MMASRHGNRGERNPGGERDGNTRDQNRDGARGKDGTEIRGGTNRDGR